MSAADGAPIRFACPAGHELVVAAQHAGRTTTCPHCGATVTVPEPPLANVESSLPTPLTPADFAKRPPPEVIRWESPTALGGALLPLIRDGENSARYEADPRHRRRGHILALAQGLIALVLAAGAVDGVLTHGAVWSWLLLGLTALTVLYLAGTVTLPDWSTVWLGQWVFGLVALIHLGVATMLLLLPAESIPWGIPTTGAVPLLWCVTIFILSAAMVYACHRVASPWRDEYEAFRLQHLPSATAPLAAEPDAAASAAVSEDDV